MTRVVPGRAGPWNGHALIDAHVHFHSGFDPVTFFRAARTNLEGAAGRLAPGDAWVGILVLTEGAGDRAFEAFRQEAGGRRRGPVCFELTDEDESVLVREDGAQSVPLVVVAGRQVQTAEGLEVLALPVLEEIPDGMTVSETIARTLELGGVPVLPWGFGKWLLGRGRLVAGILGERRPRDFLLADTGHRPPAAPYPTLLRRGEREGLPVITGSDPLPLAGEDRRAGASCFALAGPVDPNRPAAWTKRALEGLRESPPRHDRPQAWGRFARVQLAMQWRKRIRSGS